MPRAAETYRGYRRNHEPDKRRSGRAQHAKRFRKALGWTQSVCARAMHQSMQALIAVEAEQQHSHT